MNNYARFWLDTGENLESAREMAELAYKVDPKSANYLRTFVKCLIKSGETEKAIELYGPDYIKDYMDNGPILNSYAWFWAEPGKNLKNALKASKRSIELEPENHNYLDTVGVIYWKMKNYDKAIENINKALELSPDDKDYKKRLAEIKKRKNL